MGKKTVVIGASGNPDRYAYKASVSLQRHGHEVIPVGLREGNIGQLKVLAGHPPIEGVDTVTLYVGPANQHAWIDYIISLKPKRVIFNPGTENTEMENKVSQAGIEVVFACTLVMLSIGDY
jgi:predicted CoA-binding protein